MDIRSHVSMVFHLDKCIGCHTCSIASIEASLREQDDKPVTVR